MSRHKNTLNKEEDHNILIGYNKLFFLLLTWYIQWISIKSIWDDPSVCKDICQYACW